MAKIKSGLLIAAFVLFLIAAFVPEGYRGRLVAIGLALVALALALGQ